MPLLLFPELAKIRFCLLWLPEFPWFSHFPTLPFCGENRGLETETLFVVGGGLATAATAAACLLLLFGAVVAAAAAVAAVVVCATDLV